VLNAPEQSVEFQFELSSASDYGFVFYSPDATKVMDLRLPPYEKQAFCRFFRL